MAVDGSYETVVKSPLGDQKATLTVQSAGSSWTGSFVGAMGSAEVTEGMVDGNTIRWKMAITVPMPMSLEGEATIDGDTLNGQVAAGAFGAFPMTGTRVG